MANKLIDTQPVPKTRLPNLFQIRQAPGMGLGIFAKHDIKVHELIFAERPLVVYPTAMPYSLGETKGLTDAELYEMSTEVAEGWLKKMVDMMTPEDAKAFISLNNCHKGEALYGIMRSNMIKVEIIKGEHGNGWEGYGYSAVGKVGSRFNHRLVF